MPVGLINIIIITMKPRVPWFIFKKSIVFVIILLAVLALFCLIQQGYDFGQSKYLKDALVFLTIFIVTFWVFKINLALFDWYAQNVAAKTQTNLDDKFIPLFKRLSSTIIWSLGLIVFLGRLGVNINALVATLGVGSLAIALAAQDTISNIIAGFLIMIDHPFSVGEEIKLPSGEKVKVLDIGIRRSKFLSQDEAIVIMPNLELSKSKITNYSQLKNIKRDV